jgi:hypothetical protein
VPCDCFCNEFFLVLMQCSVLLELECVYCVKLLPKVWSACWDSASSQVLERL